MVELGDAHPLAGRDRLRLIHGHRPDRTPKRGLWGRWRAASVLHRRSLRAGQPSPRRTPALPIPWPSGSEQQTVAFALDVVDGVIERTRDERAQLQSLQASAADALHAQSGAGWAVERTCRSRATRRTGSHSGECKREGALDFRWAVPMVLPADRRFL